MKVPNWLGEMISLSVEFRVSVVSTVGAETDSIVRSVRTPITGGAGTQTGDEMPDGCEFGKNDGREIKS